MIEGLGTALSALTAQQQRMDALAHDTANLNTAGYRARHTSFTDMAPAGRGVAARVSGPAVRQGALIETGRPLDLAIEGDAWFQVVRPGAEPALMRAGRFDVDATGQIVNAAGDRLVPPVQLPPGADAGAVTISPDGAVTMRGTLLGRIALVTVPAPGGLTPLGDGLYAPGPASGGTRVATGAVLRQGALEASNVDMTDVAVGGVEARTAHAAAAVALRQQDEMLAELMRLRSHEG
jgi:flagellar basal-body rod protein FlgG